MIDAGPDTRTNWLMGIAIISGLALVCPRSGTAQTAASWAADSAAAHAAVTRFLTAFENLDWEAFRTSFDDEATVFFPAPEPPDLHVGRAAIETRFRIVFEGIRGSAPEGPPFHKLEPQDLRIEPAGATEALVTFHLRNESRVARRTLLLRETAEGWRIVHLHASNAVP